MCSFLWTLVSTGLFRPVAYMASRPDVSKRSTVSEEKDWMRKQCSLKLTNRCLLYSRNNWNCPSIKVRGSFSANTTTSTLTLSRWQFVQRQKRKLKIILGFGIWLEQPYSQKHHPSLYSTAYKYTIRQRSTATDSDFSQCHKFQHTYFSQNFYRQ